MEQNLVFLAESSNHNNCYYLIIVANGGEGHGTYCFSLSDKHTSQQPAVLHSPVGITMLKSIVHSRPASTRDQGALTLEYPTSHLWKWFPITSTLHLFSTLLPIPMQKEYVCPAFQGPKSMGCKESSFFLPQPWEKSTFLPLKISTDHSGSVFLSVCESFLWWTEDF